MALEVGDDRHGADAGGSANSHAGCDVDQLVIGVRIDDDVAAGINITAEAGFRIVFIDQCVDVACHTRCTTGRKAECQKDEDTIVIRINNDIIFSPDSAA